MPVPQLSSSKPIDLTASFDLTPGANSPKKALFIGINYIGQQGELNGCHNDVIQMKQFLESQGFASAEFRYGFFRGAGTGLWAWSTASD